MKSLIAACVCLLHVSQCFAANAEERSFKGGNYVVNWTYYPMYDKIKVQVTVNTTGWVGFGFAKSAPNTMKDYDVVVGGVKNGTGYLNDYFTGGQSRPPPDNMQNYNLTDAKEENGATTLMFERKGNTGDDKDVQLMAGEKLHLIWCYHLTMDGDDPGTFPPHGKNERGVSEMIVIVPGNGSAMTPATTPSPSPSKANVIGGWAVVNVVLAVLLSFLYVHL